MEPAGFLCPMFTQGMSMAAWVERRDRELAPREHARTGKRRAERGTEWTPLQGV